MPQASFLSTLNTKEFDYKLGLSQTVKQLLVVDDLSI
jgi:hypothetical protein